MKIVALFFVEIEILELGVTPEKAPDVPKYITIGFEKQCPAG